MKRTALALTLMLALVISVIVGTHFIDHAVCKGTLIVVVNSPQNGMYASYNVVVSISASDPELHTGPDQVAYSLDGGPRVVIALASCEGLHSLNGSTVLSLPNGVHSIVGIGITWFNGTTDGIFYSAPVYFTVDSPTSYIPTPTPSASPFPTPIPTVSPSYTPTTSPSPEPHLSEPFPTTWVATGIVSVAVVSVSLLVYFKKRNHKG
jgi:hypothetical protein